jgi:hypothetical protein
MSAEPNVVVQQREPTADVVKVERPFKYQFSVLFVSLIVLAIVVITTATGQWTKLENTSHHNNDNFYDLWGQCICQDADDFMNCKDNKRLFRTAAGISVIAVVSQFISITMFLLIFTRLTVSNGARIAGIVFAWLAAIALVITWAIFAGNYNQRYCGNKLKAVGDLHWSFGLRIGEFVIWTIVAILFTMYNGRPVETKHHFLRNAIIVASFIFAISIATTTGRGWILKDDDRTDINVEVSLWQACQCRKTADLPCKETRRLFRAQEAFALLSIIFTAILFWVATFRALPRFLHIIFAFFSWASILITWVVFSQFFSQGHCGTVRVSETYDYYWPFGLNVSAFCIGVLLWIVTWVGTFNAFDPR